MYGFGGQTGWGHIRVLVLTRSVTLGKMLSLSGPSSSFK